MSDRETADGTETKHWVYDGRECKVVRIPAGHYCGYAKTPLRFAPNDTGEVTGNGIFHLIEIHGGISYGVDEDGWLGFHTAHSHDYNVDEDGDELREDMSVYDLDDEDVNVWDKEAVREEVRRLADQLTLIESFVEEVDALDQ